MIFLLSYALIFLAAANNAFMDRVENLAAFNQSIFKNLDQTFWCKEISWKYAKKIFGYKIDAWHLSKSSMIISFIGAILVFTLKHQVWVHFISMGLIWNVSFNLFYNHVLKSK